MLPRSLLAALAVAVFSPSLFAAQQSFLPPNNLRIPIGSVDDKGISQPQFDAVLDRVQAIYGPIIAAKGGVLVINRHWDDDTVNAYAQRQGNQYLIDMFGGLARHQAVTQDGFALVACHELGHHLGGFPKIGGTEWATNEGGADYFGNLKCLRRIFADPSTASFTRMEGQDEQAKAACAAAFPSSKSDQAQCVRGTMAGISLATLLAGDGAAVPNIATPDPAIVQQTDDEHPAAQCRLDTYFQAALCPRSYKEDMSDTDPSTGACTASRGYTIGLRPRCWYKPAPGEVTPDLSNKLQALVAPDAFRGL